MARKQQASGVVEAISKKQIKTRNGQKPVYSFLIDDEWYRTNFTKPSFEEGDEIEFDYVVGDYGNDVDVDSVEIVTEGGGAEASLAVPFGRAVGRDGVTHRTIPRVVPAAGASTAPLPGNGPGWRS